MIEKKLKDNIEMDIIEVFCERVKRVGISVDCTQ
jgi:hypothetical protein